MNESELNVNSDLVNETNNDLLTLYFEAPNWVLQSTEYWLEIVYLPGELACSCCYDVWFCDWRNVWVGSCQFFLEFGYPKQLSSIYSPKARNSILARHHRKSNNHINRSATSQNILVFGKLIALFGKHIGNRTNQSTDRTTLHFGALWIGWW